MRSLRLYLVLGTWYLDQDHRTCATKVRSSYRVLSAKCSDPKDRP
jgi:hypothetical protein